MLSVLISVILISYGNLEILPADYIQLVDDIEITLRGGWDIEEMVPGMGADCIHIVTVDRVRSRLYKHLTGIRAGDKIGYLILTNVDRLIGECGLRQLAMNRGSAIARAGFFLIDIN